MKKRFLIIVVFSVAIVILGATVLVTTKLGQRGLAFLLMKVDSQPASVAAVVTSPFRYTFLVDGTLHEIVNKDNSSSPYWWLSSGGKMILASGLGQTVHGELSQYDKWRLAYAASNPVDTDNGYHPQNIFRIVTRSKWQNFTQEAYFLINKDNLSVSPNRNASNGLLFFNRYQDSQSLYYTGIRVDGYTVIKKKIKGVYYTMAYKPFINITQPYNRDKNPNLLPKNTWIGLRSEVETNTDGTVSIKLYVDQGKTGNWVLAAQAVDDGESFGGAAIANEGFAGIRTDFMDVQFDNYKISIK